jgi:histidinol phosphatase-like enzyme (inositol monophosphatase family)
VAAARRAGAATLAWFNTPNLTVNEKADRSPVTAADRAAEEMLRRELLAAFPDDAFLGEESGATGGGSGYEWVVDPIDGTKSFIRGVPLYATIVGCRQAAEGVLGVIVIPALDEYVFAARGGGAWHGRGGAEPVPARVSGRAALDEALLCTSDFASFLARPEGRAAGEATRRAVESACRIPRTWGDGYGYLLVATGRAEVMIDPLMNRWDAAAVETVVIEAGGRFTDWQGRGRIDAGEGLATNGLVHDAMLRLLAGGRS